MVDKKFFSYIGLEIENHKKIIEDIKEKCGSDTYKNRDEMFIAQKIIDDVLRRMINQYNKKELKKAMVEKREPKLLPHISAHTLRHTGCTRMAECGVDVKTLQYIMGHESIATTMDIYNHVDTARVTAELQKMSKVKIG